MHAKFKYTIIFIHSYSSRPHACSGSDMEEMFTNNYYTVQSSNTCAPVLYLANLPICYHTRATYASLPAFHGHAGNISVNYSVYGYVESNDFVRRSGHTCLLNTCSQLLIVNFSVLVASLTGLRCIPLDFMLFISRMKIRTKFLNRLIQQKLNTLATLPIYFTVMHVCFCSSQLLYSQLKSSTIG